MNSSTIIAHLNHCSLRTLVAPYFLGSNFPKVPVIDAVAQFNRCLEFREECTILSKPRIAAASPTGKCTKQQSSKPSSFAR